MSNRSSFWDDPQTLISKAHQVFHIVETLKLEARRDLTRTPRPALIAKMIGLSLEETKDLVNFVYSELGEYEAEYLRDQALYGDLDL